MLTLRVSMIVTRRVTMIPLWLIILCKAQICNRFFFPCIIVTDTLCLMLNTSCLMPLLNKNYVLRKVKIEYFKSIAYLNIKKLSLMSLAKKFKDFYFYGNGSSKNKGSLSCKYKSFLFKFT